MGRDIENFGRNVRFSPQAVHRPKTEPELLRVLQEAPHGPIRVTGARHAWSPGIATTGTLIDLAEFTSLTLIKRNGETLIEAGAGCRIHTLLKYLNRHQLTLPAVGLISEQTIAGAIATGTHGSGRPSLSHFVRALTVATINASGQAEVRVVSDGNALRAGRCALGALGVVTSVTLPCVPQYGVREQMVPVAGIEDVLQSESDHPLQQFYLIPHSWTWYVQRRHAVESIRRSWHWWIYRIYWFTCIDVALHILVKTVASVLQSRRLTRLLFRVVLPLTISSRWKVTDRSDRALIMEHELFRHLELEAFVPDVHICAAARFVTAVLRGFDGAEFDLEASQRSRLQECGLFDALTALTGTWCHHYPVCFRRVLRDDTLISASSGSYDAWYAISFITYVQPRDKFFAAMETLARCLHVLFEGRIHWGKWFPFDGETVERMYPRLDEFREQCRIHDPAGRFVNEFLAQTILPDAAPK